MAIIYREIECLKQLKQIIRQRGLKQLDSIKQIDDFLLAYQSKLNEIYSKHEKIINDEIEILEKTIAQLNNTCDSIKEDKSKLLASRISILSNRIVANSFKNPTNILTRISFLIKDKWQKYKITHLENNKRRIISNSTKKIERRIKTKKKQYLLNTLSALYCLKNQYMTTCAVR